MPEAHSENLVRDFLSPLVSGVLMPEAHSENLVRDSLSSLFKKSSL